MKLNPSVAPVSFHLGLGRWLLALALLIACVPAWGQGGVVLMGIDAEDGSRVAPPRGPAHGDFAIYRAVVENLLECVDNGKTKLLVIGGDNTSPNDVNFFWREVASPLGLTVEHADDPASIATANFADVAILAVASGSLDPAQVGSGGLIPAEHDALVQRQQDISAFVNGGGGLIGMSSEFKPSSFGYLAGVGAFNVREGLGYSDIDVAPAGVGLLSDALAVSAWHNTFLTFPDFLEVLATNARNGEAAAIGGCGVTVPSPCADVLGHELLCATDGSGDFTYTFIVTNNTDEEIHHLFLLEPSAPVEIVPDYFSAAELTGSSGRPLCSSADPGCDVDAGENRSQPLTVTIKNASPEDVVSFLISIHDEAIAECCSVEHTIELPSCECAQISSRQPFCDLGYSPFRIRQKYSFNFQNLLADGIDNILISPSRGSDVTVTPNHFLGVGLSGVPYIGGAGEHRGTVTLTGPDARPGKEVCLRISSHYDDFQECCSIEQCFTVGSCFITVDDFAPRGAAHVADFDAFFLRLEGFGDEGDDGADFALRQVEELDFEFLAFEETEIRDGAFVELAGFEPVEFGGRRLASLRLQEMGKRLQLRSASISGPPRTMVVRRGGVEVAEVVLSADAVIGLPEDVWIEEPGPGARSPKKIKIKIKIKISLTKIEISVSIQFATASLVDTGEDGPVLGDELTFQFAAAELLTTLASAELRGAGFEGINLSGIQGDLTDCNDNGIPDGLDILDGTSVDEDEDGMPDECQARPEDLEVRLDTGFDDATGQLVGPGAEDDDWRVLVDGDRLPARRVARPNPSWNPALAGTGWISLEGGRGASFADLDVLHFERCFCLGEGAHQASLDLELFADDRALVYLNGRLLAGPGGRFDAVEPLAVQAGGEVGAGLFRRGENCLRVEVTDAGAVVTGLDLTGTVSSEEGACTPP